MTHPFWSLACQAMPVIRILLIVELIFVILLALVFPQLSPSSPAYYVSGFSFAVITVTVAGMLVVYWKCLNYQSPE